MDISWLSAAKQAVIEIDSAGDSQVWRGHPTGPSIQTLGWVGFHLVLAIGTWIGAEYSQFAMGTRLQGVGLMLRVLTLGFSTRAVILLQSLWQGVRERRANADATLVLNPGGLLFRSNRRSLPLAKHRIWGVVQCGASVTIVMKPDGAGVLHHTLPPVFEDARSVAERIHAWLVQDPAAEELTKSAEAEELDLEAFYERATKSSVPGVAVVPLAHRWILNGPYVSILAGIAFSTEYANLPPFLREAIGRPLLTPIVLCFILPVYWIGRTFLRLRPKRGIALLLRPSALLHHDGRRLRSIRMEDVIATRIESRRSWSLVQGYHRVRQLVLETETSEVFRQSEMQLGPPIEVVKWLIERYRSEMMLART